MGIKQKYVSLGLFTTMSLSLSAWALSTYVVQKGDTLSNIALNKIGKPVYKKNGSLNKLLSYNTDIKNADRIYPGQIIKLDDQTTVLADRGVSSDDAPVATQVPVLAKPQPEGFKGYGEFTLKVGFDFFRINGTDATTGATALILSNASPTVALDWTHHWSEKTKSYLRLNYLSATLQDPYPRTMSPNNINALGFDVGMEEQFSPNLSLLLGLGYSQQLFIRNTAATALTLDAVSTPDALIGLRYQLVHREPFDMGLKFEYCYLGASTGNSYSTLAGQSYLTSLYFNGNKDQDKSSINGQVYYGQTFQSSSIVNQNRTDVGVNLGYLWKLK